MCEDEDRGAIDKSLRLGISVRVFPFYSVYREYPPFPDYDLSCGL